MKGVFFALHVSVIFTPKTSRIFIENTPARFITTTISLFKYFQQFSMHFNTKTWIKLASENFLTSSFDEK